MRLERDSLDEELGVAGGEKTLYQEAKQHLRG
jgi:hypothetical protein